jgi:hypothetical protein
VAGGLRKFERYCSLLVKGWWASVHVAGPQKRGLASSGRPRVLPTSVILSSNQDVSKTALCATGVFGAARSHCSAAAWRLLDWFLRHHWHTILRGGDNAGSEQDLCRGGHGKKKRTGLAGERLKTVALIESHSLLVLGVDQKRKSSRWRQQDAVDSVREQGGAQT